MYISKQLKGSPAPSMIIKKLSKLSKRQYFQNKVVESAGQQRQIWSLLNFAQNKNFKSHVSTKLIPEEFNHHFTSIGRNLAAKFSNNMPEWSLPPCGHKFKMPYSPRDSSLLTNRRGQKV